MKWTRGFTVVWIVGICLLFAAHLLHLRADFPNFSPWMDYSKYTDEGWYGNGAIRHFLSGSWRLPGDFNPAAALPVWPVIEGLVFSFHGRQPGCCAGSRARRLCGQPVAHLCAGSHAAEAVGCASRSHYCSRQRFSLCLQPAGHPGAAAHLLDAAFLAACIVSAEGCIRSLALCIAGGHRHLVQPANPYQDHGHLPASLYCLPVVGCGVSKAAGMG